MIMNQTDYFITSVTVVKAVLAYCRHSHLNQPRGAVF